MLILSHNKSSRQALFLLLNIMDMAVLIPNQKKKVIFYLFYHGHLFFLSKHIFTTQLLKGLV